MTDRSRARELAEEADDPVAWFDALYREAAAGDATVPWADLVPNPHLVAWLDREAPTVGRALDVGCGYGDNAAELARRGFDVDAFDVSQAAVARASERFEGVRLTTADLRSLPAAWRGAFDLVVEIYTLQVLPPVPRADAMRALAELVAPGGTLLVIARGRDTDEPAPKLPWPLTREELATLGEHGLEEVAFEDFLDDEDPPVRRFRATWRRPA